MNNDKCEDTLSFIYAIFEQRKRLYIADDPFTWVVDNYRGNSHISHEAEQILPLMGEENEKILGAVWYCFKIIASRQQLLKEV